MSMFNPLQPVNGWGALGAPPIAQLVGLQVNNYTGISSLTSGVGVTPVPSNTTIGGVDGNERMYHVVITVTSAPGTFAFAHGLPWTPTAVWIVPRVTEGATPAAQFVAYCAADTNSSNVAVNLAQTGTYDVFYG